MREIDPAPGSRGAGTVQSPNSKVYEHLHGPFDKVTYAGGRYPRSAYHGATAGPAHINPRSPTTDTPHTTRTQKMAQLEQIEAIERRLWNAADTLRANSNYASNEYFLPVMGLIFLRHAYSRFLAVRSEIEAGLPRRGGKTRPLTKEDFSQKSAIYLQPKAEFDYLVSLSDSDDRARAIIEAMESIERDF